MKLALTGLNHNTAPVEVRERLAFQADRLPGAVAALREMPGVQEGVILSTCNRVEIAVATDDNGDVTAALAHFLAGAREVDPHWLRQYLYHHEEKDAIRHLFRVAASLDSMVLGEPQILGQLKDAYEVAKSQGALAGFLDVVMTRAFGVAKRVRTETEIGQNAVSISFAAVELARQIFGSLRGKKVILIGAGKMSELAARHLERQGVAEIAVTNRSPERARAMAELFRGRIIDYPNFAQSLPEMDVVIASTGAPHSILTRDQMKQVIGARRNRPMFLIDIAVPRNIEPAVNQLDNVFLYDIDDLRTAVEENRKGREHEAQAAERIVADEVERTLTRLRAREMAPVIVTLQQQLETVCQGEFERIRGKLGELTPQQQEALDAMLRGIVNKVAHAPIAELRKQASEPGGHQTVDVIRRVFRIDNVG
ncbi:MAG: glutamyl-tRNA reductase [Acidobacteria bacterium]|nr:glutamyl-tRNA reductase [Acidobacteriota bacterium]